MTIMSEDDARYLKENPFQFPSPQRVDKNTAEQN